MRTHMALLRKSDGAGRPSGEKRVARLEETIGGLEELVTEFLTYARPQADRLEEIGHPLSEDSSRARTCGGKMRGAKPNGE